MINITCLAATSFDTSAHQSIGVLSPFELLSITRAIPLHCSGRQFRKLDAFHVEPLAMSALDVVLADDRKVA
jgi:hypothetical protein